jgi:lipoyl(octanoyl) transferase
MGDERRNRRWRLLHAPARVGAENMARDVALMRRAATTGETVFSVYAWARPTLSFGRNQPARGRYDVERMRSMGVDAVRRPTGGRALLHHREVTYSVTAPIAAGDTLSESYKRINNILVTGLLRLGVIAGIAAPSDRATPPNDAPCFATPARGELIVGQRKLAGSAQWRHEGALLQHGSILIEDDQSMIALLALRKAEDEKIPAPATLTESLGRAPNVSKITDALFDAVRELEDPGAATLDESEVRQLALAELPHFENELWTWRR